MGLCITFPWLDKVPLADRDFTAVWQTLATPQGTFFRAFNRIFRWDGKQMHIGRQQRDQISKLCRWCGAIFIPRREGIGWRRSEVMR